MIKILYFLTSLGYICSPTPAPDVQLCVDWRDFDMLNIVTVLPDRKRMNRSVILSMF